MAGAADNRTEKPTYRRLEKAREKGQVARSKEVPAAVVLFGTLMVLHYTGQGVLAQMQSLMRRTLTMQVPGEMSIRFVYSVFVSLGYQTATMIGPLLLTAVVLAIAANVGQTRGLLISWEPLGFHFGKINPANGWARVFSKQGLIELIKSLCILAIVSLVSYQVLSRYTFLYPHLVVMDLHQLVHWTASISYEVFLRVAVFLVILSFADYAFQKHRFLESLKMTKQEVKDDYKEMEGDPLVKGRIRRVQREMVRKRMMTEVPKADVVITNPTHYAVALSYKMNSMEALKMVAKGVGFLALKIKELAQEHNIPLVENKILAQTLYKTVEIGEYIPASLYRAVAEILAYIYKARNAYNR